MAEREECTGIAAQWCPNCGTCNCPEDPRGGRTRDRETCPLHGAESRHAETLCAGNCGEIVSEEGARCDACEMKHLRAENAALRAIVEGRNTPPTKEERRAHYATHGGRWMQRDNDDPPPAQLWPIWQRVVNLADFESDYYVEEFIQRHPGRWWPLDANGIPCAWPVPS